MADWLTLLLALGATARLVRLAVVDDAGVLVRTPVTLLLMRLLGRDRGGDLALRLLGCPFCVGFWLALAVAATWGAWADERWWQAGAAALALSYVAGHLVSTLDDDLED